MATNRSNLPYGLLSNNKIPASPVAKVTKARRQVNKMGQGQLQANAWPALSNPNMTNNTSQGGPMPGGC